MKRKPDRRIARSRKALHMALMQLLETEPYHEITVQQILDRADVGRSTFYGHFHDKDQLLVWGISNLERDLIALTDKEMTRRTQSARRRTHAADARERIFVLSLALFEHAESHKGVYRSLKAGGAWYVVRAGFEAMLARLIQPEIRKLKNVARPVPSELLLHFLSATAVEVLTWWMERSPKLPAQQVARAYRRLIHSMI
ncbi:MAG: TetR family transcriptional regulator [Leptospirales bacterium]|nr:TetR family transcriptional regulator [Leptospirales bacterium]